VHPEDEEYYTASNLPEVEFNLGNCKRCIHKSSCGNKNKREASWCDKYRPEMKRKRGKK
jgi:hypothetical protein